MGYYTNHKITIKDKGMQEHPDALEIFDEICENEDIGYCFDDGYNSLGSEVKGYNLENDLKEISNNYKNVIFLVEGIGEENGDLWKKVIVNGKLKSYPAIITYEPINIDEVLISNE